MKIPMLPACDALVAGNGLQAMVRALSLREKGLRVLLVTSDTCLYGQMTRSGDDRPPRDTDAVYGPLLFPPSVYDTVDRLHPDRLKRHGESLLAGRGVRLLYACELLGARPGTALLAHKSGVYGVECAEVYDCRADAPLREPCFCLHTMRQGEHRTLIVPTSYPGGDAQSRWKRYEQTLERFPAGDALARGGTEPTAREGFSLSAACEAGLACPPCGDSYPAGAFTPQCANPLCAALPARDLPAPACGVERYDVVVAGGGTAGAVAALVSARQGLRTLLLEMNAQLGGTATVGGVSTYWFGLRSGATAQVDQKVRAYMQRLGLARKACLWSDDDVFPPDLKAHALLGLCLDAGVDVRFESIACGVRMDGARVTGVYYARRGAFTLAECRITLDCTGDGDLCVFAGAAHVYGDAADGMTYWASLAQYTAPDRYRNNFSTMVHVGDPLDYTRFIVESRKQGGPLYDHGRYVAARESRHIRGMATVSLDALLRMDAVDDMLYTCFSNYDPKGRLTADEVCFGLLPPNQRIAVPRGAVVPVDGSGEPIGGLLIGGKAISCTHEAFPGVRMQPDLQRQGLALAVLAACALRQGVEAWQATGVARAILRAGGDCERPPIPPRRAPRDVALGITGEEAWEWLEAAPTACAEEPPPVARLMEASREEVLPPLREALGRAAAPAARLTLSRLLLWHGDESGAPEVLRALDEALGRCDGLPRRMASVRYGQLPPDHGLMPEATYLLNSLSRAPKTPVISLFARVLDRLERGPRDWMDLRAGIYGYCECFAYVARGRGDRAMTPLLRRVLALPELNRDEENPLLRERFEMLRLTLLGALRALGDEAGERGLRVYLSDRRRPLARAAELLLSAPGARQSAEKRG